ncbi:MAG: hypothetical protein J6C84_01855 [Lachnospiraceae bacterium]|nr:hypothetical protein [Lachnospiraceae bacterium]
MNRNRIRNLTEFVITQMNHWALFPVFLCVVCLAKSFGACDDPSVLIWLAIGSLPFLFYLFRVYLQRFALLAIAHISAVAVLVMVLPCKSMTARVLYGILGAGYGIYSLYIRMTQKEFLDGECFMPVAVGFSAVSLFLVHYQGYELWDLWYLFSLIAVLGLFYLCFYLKNYLEFLSLNEGTAGHIPEQDIFRSGTRLILLFTGSAMVLLLPLSDVEWLHAILLTVRNGVVLLLRFLFSLLPEGTDAPMLPDTAGSDGYGFEIVTEEKSPLWWDIIQYTALAAVCILMLFSLYKALKKLICFILTQMRKRPDLTVKSRTSVVEIREKCSPEKTTDRSTARNLFGALGPQERIRKLYKKYILNARRLRALVPGNHDTEDPALYTAREWGILLENPDMADIYEKARYAQKDCDREDLRRMKKACR